MGQRIADVCTRTPDVALAGIWSRGSDLANLMASAHVVIDFSLPAGTDELLHALRKQPRPLVCGVSGLSVTQMDAIRGYAETAAVVYDRNMSLGIAVLQRAVADAAAALGNEFRIRIAETHHVHKKDAPSGTALKLAEAARPGTNHHANQGAVEFDVVRQGEVIGDHDVVFTSGAEVLTFSHSATTRDVFAEGAMRAALWVAGQKPGLYSMQDVLLPSEPC